MIQRFQICRRSVHMGCALLAMRLACASADSITFKSAGANTAGLTYADAHIRRIDGDQLFFTISTGQERNRSLDSIANIKIDDEKSFTAADLAFAGQKWDDAIKGYSEVLSHTSKGWLKQYAAPRLIEAGNQAHRFDAAVEGWIQIARQDPAEAGKIRPPLPTDSASTAFSAAATQLDQAATDAQGDTRVALLTFLLDVDNARSDSAGAQRVARLLKGQGSASPGDSQAQALAADTQLALARNALDLGDSDKAIAIVDAAAGQFRTSAHQAQALYIKAQALQAKTESQRSTPPPETREAADDDDWKDVVLAYMRVYAHFHDSTALSEITAKSLVIAAQIEETRLREPGVALTLYQKAASDYKDSPIGAKAADQAARLGRSDAASQP